MKRTKQIRLQIKDYVQGALVSVCVLLMSCERNGIVPEGSGSGVLIPLNVKVLGISSGDTEEVLRSGSLERMPDQVVTPLGDGLLLEMSMEREQSQLRAGTTQALESGTAFRVIAVKSADKKYVSHGDFTAGGASTNPSFQVPAEGGTYDFICISYHDLSALPATTGYTVGSVLPSLSVAGATDLLWAVLPNITVNTAPDAALSFTLTQQLSSVRLVADCSYNGWTVTGIAGGITLGAVYTTGVTMNYVTGDITASATGTKSFTWPSSFPAGQTPTSNALQVIPNTTSATVTVTIPAGAVSRQTGGAIPSVSTPVQFPGFVFTAGNSYTIRIKFKTPKFAASNIYWNSSALVFDPWVADPSLNPSAFQASQRKQGVFFKWGSLVGVSPVGNGTAAKVYYPVYNSGSGSTWSGSNTVGSGNDWSGTAFTNIPYADNTSVGSVVGIVNNSATNRLVYLCPDFLNGNPAYWNAFRGDICQYIDRDYRLPTSNEMGTSSAQYTSPGYTIAVDPSTEDGTGSMGTAGVTFIAPGSFFPASGYRRNSTGGTLLRVGDYGDYWNGSVYSTSFSCYMYFGGGNVYPNFNNDREDAFAVRCVQN